MYPAMLISCKQSPDMPTRDVKPTDNVEREERAFEAKLAALRIAIDDGDSGGVAEGSPFERVRQTLGISTNRP